MSKFTYNQCKVCGGDLIHNQATGKYICKYCGNQYTLNENNVLQQITVKDLDDQRTKIVDDIKGVINDTYIKDKKEINTLIEERNKNIIYSGETALYLHGLIDREYNHICFTVPIGYNVTQTIRLAKHLQEYKSHVQPFPFHVL